MRATLGSARQALLEGEAVAAAALPEAARRLLDSEDAGKACALSRNAARDASKDASRALVRAPWLLGRAQAVDIALQRIAELRLQRRGTRPQGFLVEFEGQVRRHQHHHVALGHRTLQ